VVFFFLTEHWCSRVFDGGGSAATYIARIPPPRARVRDYQRTVHALTSSTLVPARRVPGSWFPTAVLAGAAAAADRACGCVRARRPSGRSDYGRRLKTSNSSPCCSVLFRSNGPPAVTPTADRRWPTLAGRGRFVSTFVRRRPALRRQCARNPRATLPRALSSSVLLRGDGGPWNACDIRAEDRLFAGVPYQHIGESGVGGGGGGLNILGSAVASNNNNMKSRPPLPAYQTLWWFFFSLFVEAN